MNEDATDPRPELRALAGSLRKAFAGIPRQEWASRMGYRGLKQQMAERVDDVLNDEWLGLTDNAYDLRYNSADFLKMMAEIAGPTAANAQALIERSRQWIDAEQHAFKPYLFVDTGFKRTTEPVQVLAACEHNRRLYFDEPGFWRFDRNQQLARAKERIRRHMKQTGGHLAVWGKIQCYRFCYREDAAIVLSLDARVVDP